MKRWFSIIVLALMLALAACDATTREARRMVKRAERLADTLPDSTVRLVDSVLRMPVNFRERERMDMALLQAEALFGCRDVSRNVSKNNDTLGDVSGNVSTISPIMDDDFFDDRGNLSTSPELERAAAYYARKEDFAKAAHAALYSGFVQQHYDEKQAAMRSFKEAERYGMMAGDSLTVARAEYKMGKMLFDEYMKQDALDLLNNSEQFFGNAFAERSLAENLMAACHLVLGDYENAEICLQNSLTFAENGHYSKPRLKALNNYAVLYQLKGENTKALDCLKSTIDDLEISDARRVLFYLNLGDLYVDKNEMDSAAFYYHLLESSLTDPNVKIETKASAYGALSHFTELQGDNATALQYLKEYEKNASAILASREQKSIYRIQKQFDYESLQNAMNQKMMQRHRIILVLSLVAILGLSAFALSRVKLARTRKEEAEANANLFHFMQQNKELVESNMRHEQKVEDAAQQLSDMLHKRLMAMLKLDYCLKTPIDKIAAKDLEKEVFGDGDHWEAVKEVLDALYPGLWETIGLKYPTMDEMERRVCMLSRLKLSRLSEAALLGVSVSVLDKLRTKVRKTVEQEEKR